MWLLNLWSIWRRRKQVRLGLWSWEIHIQALEYLSDAQFDGQGRRESAGKPPQDCPGQWEKSQQAASKLHNCSRKFCFGISVLQPANKWQAQQWIRFNHPHCPASGSQSSGRAGIFHARFIPAFFCTRGLGQTASATHQCFVAHFIQFCSFDVDDDDDDDGGGGGGDACA